jgi:6-phosphogluconolactonase
MRTLKVGNAQIFVLADEPAVAREAAARTTATLGRAIDERGEAHLALTGGSSAVSLYRELARPEWGNAIAWENVHMWWGDDRFVPTDHPESNTGLAYRLLFAMPARAAESGTGAEGVDVDAGDVPGLPVAANNVHRMPIEEAIGLSQPPAWAAQRYAEEIERFVPLGAGGVPSFDVIHLGIGPDGHLMSVFPGSAALAPDAPLVMGVDAPTHVEPHLPRVTLSARVLPAAQSLVMMVSGSGKSEVLAQVLGPERDVARWPAQSAILPNAVWLVDEPATAGLRVG